MSADTLPYLSEKPVHVHCLLSGGVSSEGPSHLRLAGGSIGGVKSALELLLEQIRCLPELKLHEWGPVATLLC